MTAEAIEVDACATGVSMAASAFDDFSRRHALPSHVMEAGQVALDEVLSNVVKAGFEPGARRRIEVTLEATGSILEIVVRYNGVAFDPLGRQDPDTRAALEDRSVGGLGIYLVKKLMDSVAYERVGAENRLRLTKRLDT